MSRDTLAVLRAHLDTARALRRQVSESSDPDSAQARQAVRDWQSQRLARTYADLLASARYEPAARFFLTELYSPTDQSGRDQQLERALPKLVRFLPAGALEPIGLALELDALAETLDDRLARQLVRPGESPSGLDDARYTAAYRACDNRDERHRQIVLVDAIGHALDRIARAPAVSAAVGLMRLPARVAGFDTLQSFLERGLAAFRHMGRADEFLRTVVTRETAINDRLFAGEAS